MILRSLDFQIRQNSELESSSIESNIIQYVAQQLKIAKCPQTFVTQSSSPLKLDHELIVSICILFFVWNHCAFTYTYTFKLTSVTCVQYEGILRIFKFH